MRILVLYASRYGATKGIAERIARTLADSGQQAAALPIKNAGDLHGYDAYVIGSAAYMFSWLHEATAFVREHAARLRTKPVWLFSSGPIGTERTDAQGRNVLETTLPREIPELKALVDSRDHKEFFGAFDHARLKLPDRIVYSLPAMKKLMVDGDYREWDEIDAWARSIAAALTPAGVIK